jgi:hypothetical protein
MVSLYESILSSTKAGRAKFVFEEFISALYKINGITKMQTINSYIHFPKGFTPDTLFGDSCPTYSWTSDDDTNKIRTILDDFFKIGYKQVRKKFTDLREIPDFVIKKSVSDQKFYIVETFIFKLNENFVWLELAIPTELNKDKDKKCHLFVSFFNENKRCVNKDIINLLG